MSTLSTDQVVIPFLKNYMSNFYTAPFYSDLYGKTFKTTEQYFMYEKAIFFGDTETADKIMLSTTPQKAKELGREVKNFVEAEWSKVRYAVMYDANLLKFLQTPDIAQKLVATKDALLVECNIKDKIWSCGLDMKDPNVADQSKWLGQNLLGKVLMDVRKYLIEAGKDV